MFGERKTLAELREDNYGDPGELVEECGAVAEALDAILDGLQKRLGKRNPHWKLDLERIEHQIEQFYYRGDLPHGGRFLNWYFSVEGERAIRLALSILEGIRTHQEYRYPETFRNISKLVFGWLRKLDPPCTWYWDVPEFRPFLLAHMPTREGETVKPPRYWNEDFEEGGWPTLQRVIREVLAQRDISMLESLRNVRALLRDEPLDLEGFPQQLRRARGFVQMQEPRWYTEKAEDALRQMFRRDPRPGELRPVLAHVVNKRDLEMPYLQAEFVVPDSMHMLPGGTFELCLTFSYFRDNEKELWDVLERTVAFLLILEGIERVGAAPSWNSFQATERGKRAIVPLRLKSPVGRLRIEFASIGEQRNAGAEFYVGTAADYLNAGVYLAPKLKESAKA